MRPESFELNPENYPFQIEIPLRYGDLDTLGHVNNVSSSRLMEEARMRFGLWSRDNRPMNELREQARMVTASVLNNYIAEIFYPEPITVYVGVLALGNTSYTISSIMFQAGKAVGHCRAVLVRSEEGVSTPLPSDLKEQLKPHLIKKD